MKTNNALDWVNNLEESGMSKDQAMAIAQILHESHETLMENMREMFAEQTKSLETNMATKADVKEEINRLTRFTAILWLSVVGLTVALRFFG